MKNEKNNILNEFDISTIVNSVEPVSMFLIVFVIGILKVFFMLLIRQKAAVSVLKIYGDYDEYLTKKIINITGVSEIRIYKLTDDEYNAFCTGSDLFYTEKIASILTENELIAVMLHEVGHYYNKDITHSITISTIFIVTTYIIISLLISIDGLEPIVKVILAIVTRILGGTVEDLYNRIRTRKIEFRADSFTKKYGYNNHLSKALYKLNIAVKKEICTELKLDKVKCGNFMDQAQRRAGYPTTEERMKNLGLIIKFLSVLSKKITPNNIQSLIKTQDKFDTIFNKLSKTNQYKIGMSQYGK